MRRKSGLALDTLAVTTTRRIPSVVLTVLHVRYVHGGYKSSSSYGYWDTLVLLVLVLVSRLVLVSLLA